MECRRSLELDELDDESRHLPRKRAVGGSGAPKFRPSVGEILLKTGRVAFAERILFDVHELQHRLPGGIAACSLAGGGWRVSCRHPAGRLKTEVFWGVINADTTLVLRHWRTALPLGTYWTVNDLGPSARLFSRGRLCSTAGVQCCRGPRQTWDRRFPVRPAPAGMLRSQCGTGGFVPRSKVWLR